MSDDEKRINRLVDQIHEKEKVIALARRYFCLLECLSHRHPSEDETAELLQAKAQAMEALGIETATIGEPPF